MVKKIPYGSVIFLQKHMQKKDMRGPTYMLFLAN